MIDIFSSEAVCHRGNLAPLNIAGDDFPALKHARGMSPDDLVQIIAHSCLIGKGGALFSTYQKIDLMRRQTSAKKYLVVNGSEHEPGSLKDRYLLERHPETVLQGALILAHAVGASEVLLTINQGASEAIAASRAALERMDWCVDDGTGRVQAALIPVPDSYLVGEESALLEVLEGRQALPRKKPPFPVERGLYGCPTLIQNVETVAHVPFIIAHGADVYRSLGIGAGVTLCTFGAEFARSGVQMIPMGISLRELIYDYGGGLKSGKGIKAIQPGGPSAGYLTASQFDTPFLPESLKLAGSAMGCAAIRAFSYDDDIVVATAEIADFFARNSCGQCSQCRMETQMLSAIMKQTVGGGANRKLLNQIPVVIKSGAGKGICGLIKMPVDPILSALKKFGDEFDRYIKSETQIS